MHVSFEPCRNIDAGFKNSRPKSMYEERQRNLDCRGIDRETTNRKNYKNWTREIFTSVEKKSSRANQIKEDYFPI